VLVTGPTGAGKTTTLYAGLNLLNDQTRNILTVEDPVEYAVEGIGQTQVNAKVGMTFAAGLRAILRQDPDVVMVGEIRDQRNRRDRRSGLADRTFGAVDRAHQFRRRRDHAPARHGRGKLFAGLDTDRGAGAAPGAPPLPALQTAL
jgi:energy-coupling factor transporter ATP-binding protein EcfA2